MIAWFARNGVAANLLMLAVMVAGIWTLANDKIPLEVFQDVPSRIISVNVPYPASSPDETEETIVLKIEEAAYAGVQLAHLRNERRGPNFAAVQRRRVVLVPDAAIAEVLTGG